jgi:hypothetical protein
VATQRTGWRQRHLLSRAIASAERTLAGLDQQIFQLETTAAKTTTGNDHPAATSHAAAKPNTTGSNPPRYLLAALGGWPHTQAAQAVWRIAANQIDAYRLRAGINDPKTALGPQPDAPDRRPAYDAVARLVQDAAAAIDALEGPTPPDPNDDLGLPGPL